MAFTLTTPAFHDGDLVPTEFTCDGRDAAPDLGVSDVPEGTRSFALIMLAYDIPTDGSDLAMTQGKTLRNGFGRTGYGGPCPPPGDAAHRYIFTLYAVDVPSLGVRGDSRQDLEDALKTHTLGTTQLTGRYQRAG
jgi:phosphatidylethanolamine-binding protein (PEBP) family uncharacterized protein